MAYDSNREVVVLFGGNNGSYLGDTWELRRTARDRRSAIRLRGDLFCVYEFIRPHA